MGRYSKVEGRFMGVRRARAETTVASRTADDLRVRRVEGAAAVREAVGLLSASFKERPQFVDLFPDAGVRQRALRPIFSALVSDAVRDGRVDGVWVGSRLAGAAVWYPPHGYPLTPARQLRSMPELLRVALAAPRSVPKVVRFQAGLADLLPAQPYWYLAAIGVDPTRQGAGIGTRMLRTGLAQVDATGQASYLETQTVRNVDWYRSHGFEVRDSEIVLTPGGPPNWTMYRPGGRP